MVYFKNQASNMISRKVEKNSKNYMISNVFIVYLFLILCGVALFFIPENYRLTAAFYYSVILSSVFFSIIAKSKNMIVSKVSYSISFFILFFVLGFRNFSGIDDPTYMNIFYNVSYHGWFNEFIISSREPGYLILNHIVALFTNNYLYMQLLTTFIPLFIFYRGFIKYKDQIDIPLSIFLFCTMIYFQMLSVSLIRMFIAISIVFHALYYISEQNKRKYILLILLAATFHYSSLFMLVFLYFFNNRKDIKKEAKKFYLSVLILIPIIFIFVAKFLVPLLGSRYSSYANIGQLALSFLSFDTIPLLVLILFFQSKISKQNKKIYTIYCVVFSLSSIISVYSSAISLGRLIFYTNSSLFIVIPLLANEMKHSYKRVLLYLGMILYGLLYLHVTQFSVESHVLHLFPYQNIFLN